jgi:exodeoxyribonuclease VIII
MEMTVSTVLWWIAQSDQARQEVCKPAEHVTVVLDAFSQWIGPRDAEVWGNGASFDNVILTNAYTKCILPIPWKFYNDRCYRTLKNLRPNIRMPVPPKIKHHALEDATAQALHLIEILK